MEDLKGEISSSKKEKLTKNILCLYKALLEISGETRKTLDNLIKETD